MRKYSDRTIVKNTEQPTGGFLKKKLIEETVFEDNRKISSHFGIDKDLVQLAVNSLTKYLLTGSITEGFKIMIIGAKFYCKDNKLDNAKYKEIINGLSLIDGLKTQSIYVALHLAQFERYFRHTSYKYKNINKKMKIKDEVYTAIDIMVRRNLEFFKNNGPVIKVGFDYQDGKPEIMGFADVDVLTRNGVFDLTISKSKPSTEDRMLALLHLDMLRHSPETKSLEIREFGIFNAFRNTSYTVKVEKLNPKYIRKLDRLLKY